ncbi:MAG: hypothetical protein P8186_23910 [Anaerolineae bacterium]|jgi:hypothetical protein
MTESLRHKLPVTEAMFADSQPEELTPDTWQVRLLPLMSHMVIGLTLFFFVASFAQLAYLHWSISRSPRMELGEALAMLSPAPDATLEEMLAASHLKVLATLEANALERRHHQANVLLMSRVWTRYLGFVTGMILALVGCSFILGKLQEPPSEVTGKSPVADFSLKSNSPGIILAGLGVILMLTTIIIHHEITVRDVPLFLLGANNSSATIEESVAPYLEPFKPSDSADLQDEGQSTP